MQCCVCNEETRWLIPHLTQHGLTEDQYRVQYPGAETSSPDFWISAHIKHYIKSPTRTPVLTTPKRIQIGGVKLDILEDVPQEVLLPSPPQYRLPECGALGSKITDALIAWKHHRSMYIYGPPGSGKDGFVHYLSHATGCPALIFQIQPGTSIKNWFFTLGFSQEGSRYDEGVLLKALRDGYGPERIPYLILLTDFDRADKNQAEALRLIMDSIEGRVQGPLGETYRVVPGTRVIATANTAGGGDERGRMVSARPIDASLLDRFERVFYFPWMEWQDEHPIICSKFPGITKYPELLAGIGKATTALRKAVADEKLYGEFSHRALCGWVSSILEILEETHDTKGVVRRAAEVSFIDKFPTKATREAALLLIDPFFKGVV